MINSLGICYECQHRKAFFHVAWFAVCSLCLASRLARIQEWELRMIWARLGAGRNEA